MKVSFNQLIRLFLLGSLPFHVMAQPTTSQKYTLQQCLDIAISNNLDVKTAASKIENSDANARQAKAIAVPNVSGSIAQGISQGRSINPYTNSYIDQQINTAQYGLNASLVLWNGSSIQNNIKQNQLALEASKKDYEQAKNDLTINVILAYLQILSNQDQLELAKQQAAVTKQQVERLELLFKDGAIAPATLYDQKGQFGNDQLNIIATQNALETSKIQLVQYMNIPYSAGMELEPMTAQSFDRYPYTIEEIATQAMQRMALVKAAELRLKVAGKAVAVAKGQLTPTLSLNGFLGTNYSNAATSLQYINTTDVATNNYVLINNNKSIVYTPQDNYNTIPISYGSQWVNNLNSYIGLGLQIPILNAAKIRTALKLAHINEQLSKVQSQTIQTKLRQSIEQAYINMKTAYDKLTLLEQQVKDYTESFRAATVKFEAGAITSVDYIIAKNNMDHANTNLIASRYDYILKTKRLDYYQGKSLF